MRWSISAAKTAPVFRSRADATLAAKLYARAPVLIQVRLQEEGGDINPWGITLRRRGQKDHPSLGIPGQS
jgi:hypothetical protein